MDLKDKPFHCEIDKNNVAYSVNAYGFSCQCSIDLN